jgi:hypothetical protein
MSDDDDPITKIICAACKAVLGFGCAKDEMTRLAHAHHEVCTASKEDYEQAVFDLKFKAMIREFGDTE